MSADGFNAFGQLPAAPSPQELMFYELNDLGNAKRLIRLAGAQFGDHDEVDLRGARLLYLRDHGWIAFDGVRWDLARGPALARKLAHRVAEGLWAQAAAFARSRSGKANAAGEAGQAVAADARSEAERREAALDAQAVKVKPKKDRQDPAIADFYEFARSSGNAGRTNALLQQAESYLLVELDAFDCDPLAFNVRNGTLRFAKVSGGWEMRFSAAHDPADRITRVMEVDYDPKATAPRWNKAIAAWQPAAPMRDFLARISGYGATGDTSEQAFFIYQGLGGDGKPPRRRRGPPADGKPEKRVLMVLTTSKLSDTNGVRLRRGRLVAVPERRVESLVRQGRIRKVSAEEAEVLTRRYGDPAPLA